MSIKIRVFINESSDVRNPNIVFLLCSKWCLLLSQTKLERLERRHHEVLEWTYNEYNHILTLVINQLDAQNFCFTISFISGLHMFRAPCAHRHEVKIVLYSIWYHHTYGV